MPEGEGGEGGEGGVLACVEKKMAFAVIIHLSRVQNPADDFYWDCSAQYIGACPGL